jgi:transposase
LETSFLPGRAFTSPGDFNSQLSEWLVRANSRQHRALGCRPVDRWPEDRAAMLTLPPVTPALGWRTSLRLPRDHYVRVASNDYSVHPGAVGRRVDVVMDLAAVTVTCAGRTVAVHDRSWAAHQVINDSAHLEAAVIARAAHRAAARPAPVGLDVEQRSLTDYDTAFGLDAVVA